MKDPDIISDTRELTNHCQQEKQDKQHNMEKEQKKIKQLAQQQPPNLNSLLIPIKNEIAKDLTDFRSYTNGNVNVLKCNNQIKELHTVLRDR